MTLKTHVKQKPHNEVMLMVYLLTFPNAVIVNVLLLVSIAWSHAHVRTASTSLFMKLRSLKLANRLNRATRLHLLQKLSGALILFLKLGLESHFPTFALYLPCDF